MKIAHVLPFLTKGGGEKVTADLAGQAVLAGHEVTIIAAYPVDPAQLRDALHPDVRVLYVSDAPVSKFAVYFTIFPWLWRHRAWLKQQDIVHGHMTYGVAFAAAVRFYRMIFGLRRPAVVETNHSVGMRVPALMRGAHARMAACLDAVALVAQDEYWCAFIKRHPAMPSQFIPNGISFQGLARMAPADGSIYRREVGIPDGCRYVIGTIGRLRPDRQPWLYLPIFAEIARVFGQEAHFVIAGDGPEYGRMRLLAGEYGLEKQVHLPGLIIEPRKPLSIMDLYLTLNVGAVTGLAALEAAYLGVPVLAVQLSPNYKTGAQDWIWSDTDLSEVAQRAVGLLRDPLVLQELSVKQAACVRIHYSVEKMARSYDALYQAACRRIL